MAHMQDWPLQVSSPETKLVPLQEPTGNESNLQPATGIAPSHTLITLSTLPTIPVPRPTAVFLSAEVVELVKNEACVRMVRIILNETFFPANEATLNTMAEKALDEAITQSSNAVDLKKWKMQLEGQHEIRRLKGILTRIRNEFKDLALTSVINAYFLDLAINKRGSARAALRIERIHSLLANNSFLHGFMMLIESDGQLRPFNIPFGSNAIINMLEIILSEKQYHCFVFYDGSERWKNCLMNLISFISTTFKWALRRYSMGRLPAAEFVTAENAAFYQAVSRQMYQMSPLAMIYFDGLLVDLRDAFRT
ncbi:uncharacterized protein F5147DRAFT_658471 [Suillus discolor]|uniref:DUF6532 domain-containing protein n=1 Tax=Suillus discolor TaxID=1912936 RepID=A0A9P7ET39_9AGAM|nr:uncharacterized protein F5147DRAFT_658471 [Suillus discolor]KAG2089239.1 hypothetical protein F5147DRAFT_658471 [Suillus discolor]